MSVEKMYKTIISYFIKCDMTFVLNFCVQCSFSKIVLGHILAQNSVEEVGEGGGGCYWLLLRGGVVQSIPSTVVISDMLCIPI
jgi:hypothetical protein